MDESGFLSVRSENLQSTVQLVFPLVIQGLLWVEPRRWQVPCIAHEQAELTVTILQLQSPFPIYCDEGL